MVKGKSDIEKRLEAIERHEAIEAGIIRGLKVRCAFVWSCVTVFIGVAGSWASGNIKELKIGFDAFWAAWGQKW